MLVFERHRLTGLVRQGLGNAGSACGRAASAWAQHGHRCAALALIALVCLGATSRQPGEARLPDPSEPPPEALLASLPFAQDAPPSRIMIDLAPEGSLPFVWLLDTGAGGSMITPRKARAMGVHVRRNKSSPYRKKTVLGRDIQFWVDTQVTDTAGKTDADWALLGGDFLDDYVVEIDYPGRRVRFFDPKKYAVPQHAASSGEAVLPFQQSGTRISIELEVDHQPVRAMLDTGSPFTLLSGRSAQKIGIHVAELPVFPGLWGVLGPIEAYRYDTQSVAFGGLELPGQPIVIAPHGVYNQGGATNSVVGYDLLRNFTLRIDYKRKRIWLRPGSETAATQPDPPVDPRSSE